LRRRICSSAKQLTLYQERRVKPRRADDATRLIVAGLSRFIIAINEGHVRAILREWVTHYNRGRPHASVGPGIPSVVPAVVSQSHGRSVPPGCRVAATPILSGLHHEYRLERQAA
jgi:hypothetical protein